MEFVAKDTEGKTNHQEQLLDFFEALQPIGSEFGYRTANEMNRLMAQLEVLGLEKRTCIGCSSNAKTLTKTTRLSNKIK